MLAIVATVFIVIAVYVSAIVTANTVSTVVAGRTRLIALLRLIGSSARAQRARDRARGARRSGSQGRRSASSSVRRLAFGLERVAVATGTDPATSPTTTSRRRCCCPPRPSCSRRGSRRGWVSAGAAGAPDRGDRQRERSRARRARRAGAAAHGVALVLRHRRRAAARRSASCVGLASPLGVFIGLVGGILSFTGIVLGAHVVMPPVLRLVGRLLGTSPAARLAAENAVRHPERVSRMTIGLVIGVTLVTTFASRWSRTGRCCSPRGERARASTQASTSMLDVTVAIFTVLIGFSAAHRRDRHGEHPVAQRHAAHPRARAAARARLRPRAGAHHDRRRERRAHGRGDAATGLVLGFGYGWAGAQALLGAPRGSRRSCCRASRGRCSAECSSRRACSRSSPPSPRRVARCGSRRWSRSRSTDDRARRFDERMPRGHAASARPSCLRSGAPLGVSLGACFTACFSLAAAASPRSRPPSLAEFVVG